MRKLNFLIAITGIIFLYFLSFFSHPYTPNLQDLWKYEGKEVIVRGVVKNRMGELLEISDGKARAIIFFEDNENIEYGDEIDVRGKVGEYGDKLVVYAERIRVISKWNSSIISLPYLAENFEEFLGMNVNVTGYIYAMYSGYFYLTDEYSKYKIRVFCNESIPFEKYEKVWVKALFDYSPKTLSFYLKICQPCHGVGKYA